MYVAMNRFKIVPGREREFVEIWEKRETYLDQVPGFKQFSLLQGPETDKYSLFASHSVWESEQHFEDWTKSEAFKKAHANAGKTSRDLYLGRPVFEGFTSIL